MKRQIVRPKIIIADNTESIRSGLSMLTAGISKQLGISPKVEVVSGGVELVARVCSPNPRMNHYGLILAEVNMPDLSGLDALRKIRAAGKETPFYLMSLDAYSMMGEPSIQAGATGYIEKKWEMDEDLRAIFRKHLLPAQTPQNI